MRLRPYGDSGPLVGSFAMLENYYLTQGREWERYAWIKGRPLTGSLYQELAAILRPFVFRKYLDFGAFASMRGLHAQIRQRSAAARHAGQHQAGAGRHPRNRVHRPGVPAHPRRQGNRPADPLHAARRST